MRMRNETKGINKQNTIQQELDLAWTHDDSMT